MDVVDPMTRSAIMAKVRRRDTKPELALRRALWASGMRGWRTDWKGLPGRPDVAFTRWHVAIFVDGAFWHGHPSRFKRGQSGAYWDAKIDRNRKRDRDITAKLTGMGWLVLRYWDFDVQRDALRIAEEIKEKVMGRAVQVQRATDL